MIRNYLDKNTIKYKQGGFEQTLSACYTPFRKVANTFQTHKKNLKHFRKRHYPMQGVFSWST